MNIFCEECGKNIATVFLTRISQDEISKIQLCEECAKKIENMTGAAELMSAVPQVIAEYIGTFAEGQEEMDDFNEEPLSCEKCGTSYSDFRKMGFLGCPECYQVFDEGLGGIVSQVQRGREHRGKMPMKVSAEVKLRRRLVDLELSLAKQVAEEKYETAALVRDKIEEIKKKLASCEQRGDAVDE